MNASIVKISNRNKFIIKNVYENYRSKKQTPHKTLINKILYSCFSRDESVINLFIVFCAKLCKDLPKKAKTICLIFNPLRIWHFFCNPCSSERLCLRGREWIILIFWQPSYRYNMPDCIYSLLIYVAYIEKKYFYLSIESRQGRHLCNPGCQPRKRRKTKDQRSSLRNY